VTPDELVLRIVQADADAAVAVIEEQTAALHHPPTLPLTATNETAGHKGSRVTSKICHNGFRERPGWDNESSTFERVRIGRFAEEIAAPGASDGQGQAGCGRLSLTGRRLPEAEGVWNLGRLGDRRRVTAGRPRCHLGVAPAGSDKSCGKQTFGLGPVAAITTAGWVAGMG
jgi:hypothetical protein